MLLQVDSSQAGTGSIYSAMSETVLLQTDLQTNWTVLDGTGRDRMG
jgi:hypothetical protein